MKKNRLIRYIVFLVFVTNYFMGMLTIFSQGSSVILYFYAAGCFSSLCIFIFFHTLPRID